MVVTTRKELATLVADRWLSAYCVNGSWKTVMMPRTADKTHNALVALGPTPDPDTVDATIGNGSWTRLTCYECDQIVESVITLGQLPNYDSHTTTVCLDCLKSALDLFNKTIQEHK